MNNATAFDLRAHLATLFRHRLKILLIFFLCFTISTAFAFLAQPIYMAGSSLLVLSQDPLRLSSVLTPGGDGAVQFLSPRDQIMTEAEIFKSQTIAEQLVLDMGPEKVLEGMTGRWDFLAEVPGKAKFWAVSSLYKFEPAKNVLEKAGIQPTVETYDPVTKAIGKLMDNIDANPVTKTDVFVVTLKSPDPEFAAEAVNGLVNNYLDHKLSIQKPQLAVDVVRQESRRLRSQVDEAQRELQAFKLTSNIVSIEQQKTLLLDRLNKAEQSLLNAQNPIAGGLSLGVGDAGGAPAIPPALQQRLFELQLERDKYMSGSPAAAQVQREISDIRSRINTARQSQIDVLESEIKQYKAELRRLDGLTDEVVDLRRDVNIKEEAFTKFLKKEQETRINETLDVKNLTNVVQVEPARAPLLPEFPQRFLTIFLGAFVGMAGAIGTAYGFDTLRRTMTTRDEAEKALGEPVIATITKESGKRQDRVGNVIEFRRVAEAVRRALGDKGHYFLLVTSSAAREGRSFVAAGLANALSEQDVDVMLLQVRGSGNEMLEDLSDPETEKGNPVKRLTDKSEPATSLPAVGIANSSVIEVDLHPTKEADYGRQSVEQYIHQADNHRGVVILDAPSLGSDPEQLLLASKISACLFVVDAESTSAPVALRSLTNLKAAGGKVLGVVLNKREFVIPNWAYRLFISPPSHARR